MKDLFTDFQLESMFKENPLFLYELILKGVLTPMYTAYKDDSKEEIDKYTCLLIDKYAIHSASFYHLSCGIIEHRNSGEQTRMNGYDLFSVNVVFRAIMETYTTFNHIFIYPKSEDEKIFRYLLWKIDGLTEKSKFKIEESVREEVKHILEEDKNTLSDLINAIENCNFYKSLSEQNLYKLYKADKKKYNWRFLFDGNITKPLSISNLVAVVLPTSAYINAYKYTSIHTHSNFYAIMEFERIRGQLLTTKFTDPWVRLAIMISCLLISDLSTINNKANLTLNCMPPSIYRFIVGIANSIREERDENL
jgi:hypothetical protein